MAKEDKIKSVEEFLKLLDKNYGKGTVVDLQQRESYGDVITTSAFSLNLSSGIGGFAKGKIYEIYANPSSCKSSISYDVIGNCQKQYKEKCLIIEKEDSYTTSYGEQMGIDNTMLSIINPETQEEMYEQLILALKNDLFGVIVVDSLTAFAPKARHEGSQIMGLEAKCNAYYMRLVVNAIQQSNTTLIILQQTRSSIGGFGNPVTIPGGASVSFYAHVRIWITRSEIDKVLKQNTVKFNFVKNKLAEPFKIGIVTFKWSGGFDDSSTIYEIALEAGIIVKNVNTHTIPGNELKLVGKNKVIQFLTDNKEYVDEYIKPKVIEYLENTTEIQEIEE